VAGLAELSSKAIEASEVNAVNRSEAGAPSRDGWPSLILQRLQFAASISTAPESTMPSRRAAVRARQSRGPMNVAADLLAPTVAFYSYNFRGPIA